MREKDKKRAIRKCKSKTQKKTAVTNDHDVHRRYSATATRFALALASDSWDGDANFTKDNVTNGTLIFHTELAFVKEVSALQFLFNIQTIICILFMTQVMAMEWKDVREMRFADKVFDAQISQVRKMLVPMAIFDSVFRLSHAHKKRMKEPVSLLPWLKHAST